VPLQKDTELYVESNLQQVLVSYSAMAVACS
jgi:hypothetical protein